MAGQDGRFSRADWESKTIEKVDGEAKLTIGSEMFTGKRKSEGGEGAGISVFRTALEGLESFREEVSDGSLMAAAISCAESSFGYGTSTDRESVLALGEDLDELRVSGSRAQGLKLLMTWLGEQGLLNMDVVLEDKLYRTVDSETANVVGFLRGKSQGRKDTWVSNYNAEREAALERVEKLFVRT